MELRPYSEIVKNAFNTENYPTKTSSEQLNTEKLVLRKYFEASDSSKNNLQHPELLKDKHRQYLINSTYKLSSVYEVLDASQPWLCYWITHALSLLGIQLENTRKRAMARFLAKCQSPDGGFGGGPGQTPHLATTYAAVNALVILGTEEAYNVINRKKLLEFLWRLRQPDGSFEMHEGGEADVRGVYCALSIASLAGVMNDSALFENSAEWVVSCQTYEGGFSGCPGMEAHGGYTFCGLAALVILNKSHLVDEKALLRWLVFKQMKLEGGFQGRTNKLTDGCYSFWQGAAFPLIYSILHTAGHTPKTHLFSSSALQEYLLVCCQNSNGGLVDKPGKNRDLYHTCYTLSGLSVAQHFLDKICLLGHKGNQVMPTHPLYNIRPDHVRKALLYFSQFQFPRSPTDETERT
ncbi:unnamed protein product [Phyllotreta striolata]|uniref:Protein farnesyltransferase subunit beta n=1 Tax=Phyllotreta striolata TaxID=444603 RepID=A0A9N9XPF2_PHYSR|nr:unnamed protein product [Phyllotreta striolata]